MNWLIWINILKINKYTKLYDWVSLLKVNISLSINSNDKFPDISIKDVNDKLSEINKFGIVLKKIMNILW